MKPRYIHTCSTCILLDRIKVGEEEIDLYHHTGHPKSHIYFRWGNRMGDEGYVRVVDDKIEHIGGMERWAARTEETRDALKSALIKWRISGHLHPGQVMLIGKE